MPARRRKQTNGHSPEDNAAPAKIQPNGSHDRAQEKSQTGWFNGFAQNTALLAGRPATFIVTFAVIVVWGVSGPVFGYSGTWQLVINTGTTIVTFLMVFLIQHTQNRDTMALQIKLAELIIAMHGARNKVASAEDLSDENLEALHAAYHKRASETEEVLQKRRSGASC